MSKDDVRITEDVHVELTQGHDPLGKHRAAKKAAAKVEAAAEPEPEVTTAAINEVEWNAATDHNTVVIDRHEDWPTQDYVNKPPTSVLFERPFDSI